MSLGISYYLPSTYRGEGPSYLATFNFRFPKGGILPDWAKKKDIAVAQDGFQITAYYDWKTGEWTKILPHERRDGRAELLTPRQRMEEAMKETGSEAYTGYFGQGAWEEKNYTFTDSDGKKYNVKYYLVHETDDPKSPVGYEVIEGKSGEMVFTVRRSENKIIEGLDEKQAALVRQAWALLEAADPQIMTKFWRVNKVGGVGIGNIPNLFSSHTNLEGFGIMIFNPKRINSYGDNTAAMIVVILGEGYELLTTSQFYISSSTNNWQYIEDKPLDCLDNNAVADAAKRQLAWYKKYGHNLPTQVNTDAYDMAKSWLNLLKLFPCQSRIPFKP